MENITLLNFAGLLFAIAVIYMLYSCYKVNLIISIIVTIIGLALLVWSRKYFRLGQFSGMDIIGSLILAYFAAPCLGISRMSAMLLVIPVSIMTHKLIGAKTPLITQIYEVKNTNYIYANIILLIIGIISIVYDKI
jgi:hypothetical protein